MYGEYNLLSITHNNPKAGLYGALDCYKGVIKLANITPEIASEVTLYFAQVIDVVGFTSLMPSLFFGKKALYICRR